MSPKVKKVLLDSSSDQCESNSSMIVNTSYNADESGNNSIDNNDEWSTGDWEEFYRPKMKELIEEHLMYSRDELKIIGHKFMNNMSYFLVEHCDPTIEGQEFKTYDQMKDNPGALAKYFAKLKGVVAEVYDGLIWQLSEY